MLRLLLALLLLAGPAFADGDWVPPPPPSVQAIQNSPTHSREVPAAPGPVGQASPQSISPAQAAAMQDMVSRAALRAAVEREQLFEQIQQLQTQLKAASGPGQTPPASTEPAK